MLQGWPAAFASRESFKACMSSASTNRQARPRFHFVLLGSMGQLLLHEIT